MVLHTTEVPDGIIEFPMLSKAGLPSHKVVSFPALIIADESILITRVSNTAGQGPKGSSVCIINVSLPFKTAETDGV